jgi:tetratricopeptide (TPR) repeat protein
VTVDYEDVRCMFARQETWTLPYFSARLENDRAYALFRKQDYKHAVAGFQRAATADPSWEIPAYNAASAQQLMGDKDAAVKTLLPWLRSHPARTYLQIQRDPELSPLADRPEITGVRSKQPGDIDVTSTGIAGDIAYSADQKLIAVARTEHSWGASMFERVIELYDPKGVLVTAIPLVAMDETDPDCYEPKTNCELASAAKSKVNKRAAMVQQTLRELGFTKAKAELGTLVYDDAKRKVRLPNHKLGIVEVDGTFRLLKGNTEVTTGHVLAKLDAAAIVDDINALVVWSSRPGAEGCEDTNPTSVQVIPLKP